MYYPVLRGRQYELIAIRELINQNLINPSFVKPVVELTGTRITKQERDIAGNGYPVFFLDKSPVTKSDKHDAFFSENKEARKTIVIEESDDVGNISLETKMIMVSKDSMKLSEMLLGVDDEHIYNVLINENSPLFKIFSRDDNKRNRLISLSDPFKKEARNSDYSSVAELFSVNHLYYNGNAGFSDYSIVGANYSESGFAPYAVAIHIVYFDEANNLMIRHFVSISNDSINDPAKKFGEAVNSLLQWWNVASKDANFVKKNESKGIKELRQMAESGAYPGLGILKKLSIMHHLEIMNKFLDEGQ